MFLFAPPPLYWKAESLILRQQNKEGKIADISLWILKGKTSHSWMDLTNEILSEIACGIDIEKSSRSLYYDSICFSGIFSEILSEWKGVPSCRRSVIFISGVLWSLLRPLQRHCYTQESRLAKKNSWFLVNRIPKIFYEMLLFQFAVLSSDSQLPIIINIPILLCLLPIEKENTPCGTLSSSSLSPSRSRWCLSSSSEFIAWCGHANQRVERVKAYFIG